MDTPTDEQATQFCIMLKAGLPPEQAIQYFVDTDDPTQLGYLLRKWQKSRAVSRAQKALLGKNWQDMTLEEQIESALNQHYAALAFLCFSTNYITAGQNEKSKLDSARTALEAKKAGTAGQMSAMDKFFDDVKNKRIALPAIPTKAN